MRIVAIAVALGGCDQGGRKLVPPESSRAPLTPLFDDEAALTPSVQLPRLTSHGLDGSASELATTYTDDAGVYKVTLTEPGIKTEHDLQVGDPLAKVFALREPHRCETISGYINSMTAVTAVRCWVGSPAQFRYAAYPEHGDEPPDDGRALERWILDTGRPIELVIWHRDPER